MPFTIQHGDITKCHVDAIVNAANNTLLGGGGVDGAIHRAAGPQLLEYCRTLGGVETGKAKITPGFDLPAKYVIHTAGPIWQGGNYREKELLESSYRSALQLAFENGCESVAFPLISAGAYGYPKEEALRVARETILAYLEDHELSVFLLLYEKEGYPRPRELDQRLLALLGNVAPAVSFAAKSEKKPFPALAPGALIHGSILNGLRKEEAEASYSETEEADDLEDDYLVMAEATDAAASSLEERLRDLDEGFSRSLLRIIDEKGMKDSDCYKRANLTRQHFSKIRSNDDYHPTKETALSLCVALKLSVPESEALLAKAGYAFSPADRRDIVVRYYLEKGDTDIFTINDVLLSLDLKLLSIVA